MDTNTEALEAAKQEIFVDRTGVARASHILTAYAIAAALVALAEQVGNVAQAIAATKKQE